jgi:UDP-glucose 4-epimerase
LGFRIPDEMVNQLRFGRGIDNRLLKATGFHYGYTTRETVLNLGEHLRLAPVIRGAEGTYTYEREVEEFLRWSPYVRREHPGERGGVAADREPLGI